MRRLLGLTSVVAVVGLGTFAISASPAVADSASRIAYGPTSAYPVLGGDSDFWTCSGFRLEAGPVVEDHFSCTIIDQTFTGTFTESNPWPCGCSGWASDYDGRPATSYVIRVSSNGRVEGTATY
jgi:hypothetical protein